MNQSVKKGATDSLENGEEMAEFFRGYFSAEVEISVYEFEQEQEMNYMYPEIFTISADAVKQITFFEVDAEDIRTILEIANFPDEPVIEEALTFEGELNEPIYGDIYATEYHNDVGLAINLTIKGSIWDKENNEPYSLTLLYDKSSYDKNVG